MHFSRVDHFTGNLFTGVNKLAEFKISIKKVFEYNEKPKAIYVWKVCIAISTEGEGGIKEGTTMLRGESNDRRVKRRLRSHSSKNPTTRSHFSLATLCIPTSFLLHFIVWTVENKLKKTNKQTIKRTENNAIKGGLLRRF